MWKAFLSFSFSAFVSGAPLQNSGTPYPFVSCGASKFACTSDLHCTATGCCPVNGADCPSEFGGFCCPETHPVCSQGPKGSNPVCYQKVGSTKFEALKTSEGVQHDFSDMEAYYQKQKSTMKWEMVAPPADVDYDHDQIAASRRTQAKMGAGSSLKAATENGWLLFGDFGVGNHDQHTVASALTKAATNLHTDAVISVGDNFYYSGVKNLGDSQFQSTFEDMYDSPALTAIPWYVSLGNHDNYGNISAQVAYSKVSKRWTMPAAYYTVKFQTVHGYMAIIFLNTGANGDLVKDGQLNWFQTNLERNKHVSWLIVVAHHPVFSGGNHGNTPELQTTVKSLLENYNVTAYFCGHDHGLQHLSEKGVHYVVTGGGGYEPDPTMNKTSQSKFGYDNFGYVRMSLLKNSTNLRVSLYDISGHGLHTFYVRPRPNTTTVE